MFRRCPEEIVCLKFVSRSDVEDYYKLETKAIYAGFVIDIVEESNDKISIVAMAGDYRYWQDLGMKCIGKGVYQKWVNKGEAKIEIVKEAL